MTPGPVLTTTTGIITHAVVGETRSEDRSVDDLGEKGDRSLVDAETELRRLKAKLEEEREDRRRTEKEVSRLMKSIKRKHEDQLRQRNTEIYQLRCTVDLLNERNAQLEQSNQDMIEELSSLRDELSRKIRETKESAKEQQRSERSTTPSKVTDYLKSLVEVRSRGCSPFKHTPTKSVDSVSVSSSFTSEVESLQLKLSDMTDQLEAKEVEVRRSKERQEFVREINIELRKKNRSIEQTLTQTKEKLANIRNEIESEYTTKLNDAKKEIESLESKMSDKDHEIRGLKKSTNDLESKMSSKESQIRKLTDDLHEYRNRCEQYRVEKEHAIAREKDKLIHELRSLRTDLDRKSNEAKQMEKDKELLKQTCLEIEKQAEEYESILEKKKEEYQRLLSDKRRIEHDRDQLNLELKRKDDTIVIERQTHELEVHELSQKIRKVEEDLENSNQKIRSLKRELEDERNSNTRNIRRIRDLEEEIDRCVNEANDADEKAERMSDELLKIKEEASRHVTEILVQKSYVNQLSIKLEQTRNENRDLRQHIHSLGLQLEQERLEHDTEVFKLQEQLKQHLNLENEMATKLEKMEKKKKKPLLPISLNGESWFSPRTPHPTPLKNGSRFAPRSNGNAAVHRVEIELGIERERNRTLQTELLRTEAELLQVKEDRKMKPIVEFGHRLAQADGISHSSLTETTSMVPPPYHNIDSSPTSVTSRDDNNVGCGADDDYDDYYNNVVSTTGDHDSIVHRLRKIAVDIHHASSTPDVTCGNPDPHETVIQREEFSFSESIMEELTADTGAVDGGDRKSSHNGQDGGGGGKRKSNGNGQKRSSSGSRNSKH